MATGDRIQEEEISKMEEGFNTTNRGSDYHLGFFSSKDIVTILQKVFAEVVGTFFVIFSGCGSVVVNKIYGNVTFPGVCVTWGLIVMVMVYSLGHVSGAHFNPAVTITFAIFRRFPWKEVPLYIVAQLMGSTLASCVLALMFDVTPKDYFGTVPAGSNGQSFAIEIVISFLLMFVISGVGTDSRANGNLAGLAVGMTITLNVFVAGPVSGASMNPARSFGPAVVKHVFKGLWVYIFGPIIGTALGGFAYNLIRYSDKPIQEHLADSSSCFNTSAK
ncbi:hypothetical protein ACH5RR_013885 [Cinchona calisaya]|uniref:Aquaporin NIP-type n=1 Tax=Cinchona calisaya TaxID=153742 RepID=A0ABD3A749_9GENT